jgi:enterochelin esterase-like enzyme
MAGWTSFDAFLQDAERAASDADRQALVDALLSERPAWPWIEGERATFVYAGNGVTTAALNLDTIAGDPPFARMTRLAGTTLFYVTQTFARDDLLDYLLAIDDPMTPLAAERDIAGRVARHWRRDPHNPVRMTTAQADVSVLRMPDARPFPDWTSFNLTRGTVRDHSIDSRELGFTGRRLWVYTPPGYAGSGLAYPLLVLHDGQWANGPLQVPAIADALIKHDRLKPCVIAMIQSVPGQAERDREYVSNDRHYAFLLTELLPFVQTSYRVDSGNIAVGGVAVGAAAAAHAALRSPAVFSSLIMISPPLGKGAMQEQLREYVGRFETAETLPRRIFQSVGRYEAKARFLRPAETLRYALESRRGLSYRFVELGSGHGLVNFRSVMPEALAWTFPGSAFDG